MKKIMMSALAMCCIALAWSGCTNSSKSSEEQNNNTNTESKHEIENATEAGDEIVLSEEKAAAVGVVVETITAAPFQASIHCSGTILPAGGNEMTITAYSSGILSYKGGTPASGQKVANGQTIATISGGGSQDSPAAINYQAEKQEYERAKALLTDNVLSQKDFNRIEERYKVAKAAYEGISVKAGIGGYIKSIYKNEGDYVQAGDPVAVITQNQKLRLQADLPAKFISLKNTIKGVNLKLPFSDRIYSSEELKARVIAIGQSLEQSSAFLPVTFEFANTGDIVPGSNAEVWLITGVKNKVLAVKESALVEEQGDYFVFLQLDEECYRKQAVKLGANNGELVEILSGLNEGDKVVVEAAIQVKLASMTGIPEGHSHNH